MSLVLLLAAGLALNAAASILALWRGSVDPGGAVVGVALGTVIFAVGSPFFWLILMAFFVSSTALGWVRPAEKEALEAIHQKGNRRDLFQVLANGGMGTLMAILFGVTRDPAWALGFAVSFASSNADTWAGELGVLSRKDPVSLLRLRPVPRGVSGGVSAAGSAASLAGAAFIALIFAAENLSLGLLTGGFLRVAAFVTAAGFSARCWTAFWVERCRPSMSRHRAARPARALRSSRNVPFPRRGSPTGSTRGLALVNNDVVNFASCAAVTIAAVLLSRLVSA